MLDRVGAKRGGALSGATPAESRESGSAQGELKSWSARLYD
jgi:hypothetical protein